jgi:outer membrane protein
MRWSQHIVGYGLVLIFLAQNSQAMEASQDTLKTGNLDQGKVLRLEEAVQIALKRNLQLRASRKATRAASWGVKNAYAQFLPRVDFAFNYLRMDLATVDRANIFVDVGRELVKQFAPNEDPNQIRPNAWHDSYGSSVTVAQPLFTGGALLANLGVAHAQDVTAQANLANTEQDVILNTQKAYYEVLKAQELVNVAKSLVESSDEHLNSARQKVAAGLRSKTEILRWEVQKANAESYIVRAENALEIARPALNQVLGLELDVNYQVSPVEDVDVQVPPEQAQQIDIALRRNPAVDVMRANVDLADAQVKVARSNFTPKVSLAYNYSWEANNTLALDSYKTWTVGIITQFPIFNGFRDYTELQKAHALKNQMKEVQSDFTRGLELQVKQASAGLKAGKKQMVLVEKALALAEENNRVVEKSYDVGLASNLDYLDAQNALNQARWDYVDAKYDYLLAKATLARIMGVLGQ